MSRVVTSQRRVRLLALVAVFSACSDGPPPASDSAAMPAEVAQSVPDRSVAQGVYTRAQADRGQSVYRASCAECHLPDLAGNGVSPALVGAAFLEKRAGSSVGDFYGLVRSTMPQNAPFSLSEEMYADVVAYLLSENGITPGESDLPTATTSLEAIRFDAPVVTP